jgi:hypothetical protein
VKKKKTKKKWREIRSERMCYMREIEGKVEGISLLYERER